MSEPLQQTPGTPRKTGTGRRPAAPVLHLLQESHRLTNHSHVLCYGCGQGADVEWLQLRRFKVHGYDPHPPFGYAETPKGLYDFVFFNYLLARLKTDAARKTALAKAFGHVKPGGWLVVTSRSAMKAESPDGENGLLRFFQELFSDLDYSDLELLAADAEDRSVAAMVRRNGVYAPAVPWVWIDNREEFLAMCERLVREPVIGLDVETTLEEPRILCTIQLATPRRTFIVDALAVAPLDPLRPALETDRTLKVIHNAMFEEQMFAKHKIKLVNVYDTLTASRKKHKKGAVSGHKLGETCERELGLYLDKGLQTSDWTERPLSAAQLAYAAVDAEVMLLLHRAFCPPPPPENLELF